MSQYRDAVVGGGIVGLALARALARRGRAVTVFETDAAAQGASVRNFGTIWPIGQPLGERRSLAFRSLEIWRQVLADTQSWSAPHGSLHLAYHDDELAVLTEFAEQPESSQSACALLDPAATQQRSAHVRTRGLRGSLWSPHELQLNPRQVMERLPAWLSEQSQVEFETGVCITSCTPGIVRAGDRQWECDRVWLATGADLRTLYPAHFSALRLRRCKLQMMRTAPMPWSLGPILAGGLTLAHYECFASCPGVPALRARLAAEWPDQVAFGVHVLVSQHNRGQLVIGDSHEYDDAIQPFDRPEIDELVLDYLRTFCTVAPLPVTERWHGIYVKHPSLPYCVLEPDQGVVAIAALGGHGMTMAFGLAEQVVARALD